MQPIVNVLEDEFADQIEFRNVDANSADGKLTFQAYRLRGHPSYVLLNRAGEVLWSGVGEQTIDLIIIQLDAALGQ